MLTPTGLSGNVYNLHDGSVDLKAQADTQELSIMLPSIGDTIAEIWDLVYGGRNTNAVIKATNFRNKDIAWEDAKGEPARRGLRLTGIEGDEYNKAEVDTLAGAINTAHDLLGMIISTNTEEELQDVNNLDENRIYYNSNRHQYFRKHKTYDYTEISSDMFKYNEQTSSNLNQEKIDTGLYYEYDE
jgi:acylphosphatase